MAYLLGYGVGSSFITYIIYFLLSKVYFNQTTRIKNTSNKNLLTVVCGFIYTIVFSLLYGQFEVLYLSGTLIILTLRYIRDKYEQKNLKSE